MLLKRRPPTSLSAPVARHRDRCVGLMLMMIIIGLDLVTKAWALRNLDPSHPWVVTSFFNIVLRFNHGVSFSLFRDIGLHIPGLLLILSSVLTLVVVAWACLTANRHLVYSLSLVIGGAVGNIIDRARLGAVTDFLEFHWHGWAWPAFNVADTAICLGMMFVAWTEWTYAPAIGRRSHTQKTIFSRPNKG